MVPTWYAVINKHYVSYFEITLNPYCFAIGNNKKRPFSFEESLLNQTYGKNKIKLILVSRYNALQALEYPTQIAISYLYLIGKYCS